MRASASLNPIYLNTYASLAYGVTNHLGAQGNFNIPTNNFAGQGAIGWYNTWGHQVLEVYIGAGMGKSSYTGVWNHRTWGDFNTQFVQANYGWANLANKHIDIGFGLKIGHLEGMRYANTEDGYNSLYESAMLFEPTVCLRFGWEHLKFSLTGGYAMPRISRPCLTA